MTRPWVIAIVAAALCAPAPAAARQYTGDKNLSVAWRTYQRESATLAPGSTYPFADCFRRASIVNEVPETLLLAVARGESDFNPTARSRANAHGVMQILWPTTARHLGLNLLSELYDPCKNIDAGARYLRELMDNYDDDLHLSLAAYNYGPHRIAKGADMPSGAEWYSGYIYRHLEFVLRNAERASDALAQYADRGKLLLITFNEPYRAAAFVAALEQSTRGLQIDWFRAGQAEYSVVASYQNKDELRRTKRRLAEAGFRLSP